MLEQSAKLTEKVADFSRYKADFPVFEKYLSLHYLDSAATTQKPRCVIEAIAQCYEHTCAPVHRGLYDLAAQASEYYEQARNVVARFINAPTAEQCVFTRSATESINMVANGWARSRLRKGDEIWISEMEHHSNYLPWQRVCQDTGASLKIIRVSPDGELLADAAQGLFGDKVKLIALTQISNVLGCINPVAKIASRAKQSGIPVLIDACQSIGHMPVDVQDIDCAFMAFSAHKMYGPNGIGVLYGKQEFLDQCEPLLLGGGMVDRVALCTDRQAPKQIRDQSSRQRSEWAGLPERLEAGSPNLTGAVGFAAAIKYVEHIGLLAIQEHAANLAKQASVALQSLPGVSVFGKHDNIPGQGLHGGIVSFAVDGVHPHDMAQVAAEYQVAIRAGHHCAQPLMHALGVNSTARASFGVYNTAQDVDALVAATVEAVSLFSRKPV